MCNASMTALPHVVADDVFIDAIGEPRLRYNMIQDIITIAFSIDYEQISMFPYTVNNADNCLVHEEVRSFFDC